MSRPELDGLFTGKRAASVMLRSPFCIAFEHAIHGEEGMMPYV
jgi:hypothetical protein